MFFVAEVFRSPTFWSTPCLYWLIIAVNHYHFINLFYYHNSGLTFMYIFIIQLWFEISLVVCHRIDKIIPTIIGMPLTSPCLYSEWVWWSNVYNNYQKYDNYKKCIYIHIMNTVSTISMIAIVTIITVMTILTKTAFSTIP